MNNIEKRLKQDLEKKLFSPLDVVNLEIKYTGFTQPGVVFCKNSIRDFGSKLKSCFEAGRHPGLNPAVDQIHTHKNEDNTGLEAIESFIESESSFKTERIDNHQEYIEISLEMEILNVNLDAFLETKDFEVIKAKIQGALHSKEYK